ncbi:MAG: ABC transporter substrate-binding protein [Thermodesulfobacteriota bacterium]|nr:ABC transporter substrate-binding protein [Thermodesulfobacteriota bacterium]
MMFKSHVLVVCFVFIVLVFSQSSLSYGKEVRGVTDDTIKIAIIGDVTGPLADTWKYGIASFRTYCQYINDQGGIHGRKLKLLIEDDRGNIAMSIAAFKKIVFKDKALAFLGPGQGGGNIALFKQIEREKIVNIPAGLESKLSVPPKKYIFAIGATHEDAVAVSMDYVMKDLKAKNPKFAVVYPDIEFGKAGLHGAKDRAKFYNLDIRTEVLGVGALDATSQILNLKRAKVDYVIVQHIAVTAAGLIRDARKFGYRPTFLGTQWVCSQDLIKLARKAAENTYVSNIYGQWHEDAPGIQEAREATLKYRKDLDIMKDSGYFQGWIAGMVFTEGMKRAGKNLTGETLMLAMESIQNLDTGDICGPVSFGKNNRRGQKYVRLYKADVEKVRFMPITKWRTPVTE